jgi:hypothetical protein
VLAAIVVVIASSSGPAAADPLPGCASGAAPGQTVFTVQVSASGTPFVSTYVASAPTASGNVGCTAPSRTGAATFSVNSPNVAVYPRSPLDVIAPYNSSVLSAPTTVNTLQVGSYLLTVPAHPGLQVYQIAPDYYVVRSIDPTQNHSVIVLPLPGVPPAPNTGPIPSVTH